jgi:pyruvate/2-oxoglutarate/acetoin dehydrogenase E1 component
MRYVESLNAALHGLMTNDERVIVLGEDVLDPYGGAFKVTKGLSTAFPDRVLTTPISEAGITGVAIGLALRGFRPVLEIMFGDFLTLCADQIINGATKFSWMYNGQVSVPLVVRTPMGGRRGYGPTHSQTLEGLFFSTPGLTIVAPSNFHDPGALLHQAVLGSDEPVLFVENKLLYTEQLVERDGTGKAGDFFIETQGDQDYPCISLSLTQAAPSVTLVAYGGMGPLAADAARSLYLEDEIDVETVIPSRIKPFPLEEVLPSVMKSGRVVIVEEGVRTAGWGAELAAEISEAAFGRLVRPVVRVGAADTPVPSSKTLEDAALPQVGDIEAAVRGLLKG